jgi:hypothetical protein
MWWSLFTGPDDSPARRVIVADDARFALAGANTDCAPHNQAAVMGFAVTPITAADRQI